MVVLRCSPVPETAVLMTMKPFGGRGHTNRTKTATYPLSRILSLRRPHDRCCVFAEKHSSKGEVEAMKLKPLSCALLTLVGVAVLKSHGLSSAQEEEGLHQVRVLFAAELGLSP